MIVSDNPMSEQYFFHDLITVYSVLEREADVIVVKGRSVRAHREGIVLCTGRFFNLDSTLACKQVGGFQINTVNDINFTGCQSITPGSWIYDGKYRQFGKPTTVKLI